MKVFLLLCNLLTVYAAVAKKQCEGETINDKFYAKEILKEDIDRPYLLSTDFTTNTLYFSYSLNKDDDIFNTAYINLNNTEFADIQGIKNGFAQTVDQEGHNVYIGGSDGIHKYNYKTKQSEAIGERDIDIWNMFYKDVLYYSVFPTQFLYTLINGEAVRFKDLEDTKVDQFIIDNDDIMYYTNGTGLYSQKKGTKDAKLYAEFPNDGIRGLSIDSDGNVYVCLKDGVYSVDKSNEKINKLIGIDDAFGLAFDNRNNIIYSDATKVIRLNKDKSC